MKHEDLGLTTARMFFMICVWVFIGMFVGAVIKTYRGENTEMVMPIEGRK